VQCGAQPDEASNTLTRRPATHNRPLIRAHGIKAMRLGFSGQWTGYFPEIAAQLREIRRIDFGNADGDPADIRRMQSVLRRHCAGNPPENRRTQNPSHGEGVQLLMLNIIILRQFAINLARHFVQ